ncbi:MAG: ABC transporter ATP-binding protein/permease [Desulfurococcales archaeon]|nr:ABC transporter ATP-binding protein/permease [Desulfurococcales archaeon]
MAGRSSLGLLRRFLAETLRHRRLLALVAATIAGSSLANLAAPYLLKVAIDQYIVPGRLGELPRVAGLYLAALVAQWGFAAARNWYINVFGQSVLYDLRSRLLERSLRARMDFYRRHRTGDLVSRIINDTSYVNDVLVSGILGGLGDLVSLAGILAAMFMLNARLALVALATIPLMAAIARGFGGRLRAAWRRTRAALAGVSSVVEETVSGIETVKAFGVEGDAERRFLDASLTTMRAYLRVAVYMGLFWPLMNLSSTASLAIVAAAGAYMVKAGAASIGVVVAFIQYVQRFRGPINNVVSMYDNLQAALASLERIYEVIDAEEEDDSGVEIGRVEGRIEYWGVWFSYEPGRPVLRGVTFRVNPGETVAIVGETGAGKTTIASLLLRFYDPERGEILVDGVDTRRIRRSSLRARVSYVPQETYLFPGTVMENILIARPGATPEDVVRVCRQLGIHDYIERLPDGYNTSVGEAGKRLSAGERQLIAIARAMLRDPDVVVLDEALSSVDPATEDLVRRAMGRLMEGRTSIVIAHRLRAARDADRIVVVEGGRVVEEGTFGELMAKRGRFYRLYTTQEEWATPAAPSTS